MRIRGFFKQVLNGWGVIPPGSGSLWTIHPHAVDNSATLGADKLWITGEEEGKGCGRIADLRGALWITLWKPPQLSTGDLRHDRPPLQRFRVLGDNSLHGGVVDNYSKRSCHAGLEPCARLCTTRWITRSKTCGQGGDEIRRPISVDNSGQLSPGLSTPGIGFVRGSWAVIPRIHSPYYYEIKIFLPEIPL